MCQVFVFSFYLSAALRRCGIYYSSGCVRCLWNLLLGWKLVFAVVLPAIGICRLNKTFFSHGLQMGFQPYRCVSVLRLLLICCTFSFLPFIFFSTSRFRLVLPSRLLVISNHESTVDFIPFVRIGFMCNAEFHNLHLFHSVYPIWCLVCWCWFFSIERRACSKSMKIGRKSSYQHCAWCFKPPETDIYICVYKVYRYNRYIKMRMCAQSVETE